MGQAHSDQGPPPSLEQLSSILADRFARKCYTPLELYCFKHVFSTLAESQSGVKYWSEATLCRFLELPDSLGVGSVIFQMASYLGAFPFPSQAPAILTNEALLKVVTLFTERYAAVLKKRGRRLWLSEMYRSLAVYDRGLQSPRAPPEQTRTSVESDDVVDGLDKVDKGNGLVSAADLGFAIDRPEDGDGEDEDDDELVLAALESMDASEVFKHGEQSNMHHSVIPSDNFFKLLQLLLLIAPMGPQDSLSTYFAQLSDHRLRGLRKTASDLLASFNIEKDHGINFRTFETVVTTTMPHLFDSLGPLFEHFLFAKDIDLSKRKDSASTSTNKPEPTSPPPPKNLPSPEPVLRTVGEILDLDVLSQLSFVFKSPQLFRRLRPLYSGNTSGFSMGSFEKNVFKWNSPTLLLVSGTLLPAQPTNARERAFAEALPHSTRLQSSLPPDSPQSLVYGAYIPSPWKQTHKTCFGTDETMLFQLSPTHDVFHGSNLAADYVYFNRSPTQPPGLGLGTPIPQTSHHASTPPIRVGPVSLHLDDALEFGVFTHLADGGGSFRPSGLPGRRGKDWQDRFEIEKLEVWGIGGEEEAEKQRREWAWEEREAEARRRVNLGTGDIEADRELLKMAGLIGGNRSGGSV